MSNVPLPPFLAAAPPAGAARERYFEANVDPPQFVPVNLGQGVTILVSSDYVTAQGIRLPLWPSTAQRIADRFNAILPTKKLVDVIWNAATVKVAPRSMTPAAGQHIDDNRILAAHEAIVNGQIAGRGGLRSGHKKDVIVTKTPHPGKMVIYGWTRPDGSVIQDPSWVHDARYGNDYSTGARLISRTAYVNGVPTPIETLFANPTTATLLNETGTMSADRLRYPVA